MKTNFKLHFADLFQRPVGQHEVIDGLRAFSVLFVIWFHAFFFMHKALPKEAMLAFIESVPDWLNFVWQGDKGVDIFFLISGFLIGGHILQEYARTQSVNLRRFFRRRIFRIVPLYLLALLIFGASQPEKLKWIWTSLLFINNFFPASHFLAPHTWTITVEMQFYFCFPFLFLFGLAKSKSPGWWLVGGYLASSALLVGMVYAYQELFAWNLWEMLFQWQGDYKRIAEVFYANLYTRMGPMILGVLAARIYFLRRTEWETWQTQHPWATQALFVGSLALVLASSMLPYHRAGSWFYEIFNQEGQLWFFALNRNLFALGGFGILLCLLTPRGLSRGLARLLAARAFIPLAKLSYSAYLFHLPFLLIGALLANGLSTDTSSLTWPRVLLAGVFAFILVNLFSILTYIFLEKPMIDRGKGSKS